MLPRIAAMRQYSAEEQRARRTKGIPATWAKSRQIPIQMLTSQRKKGATSEKYDNVKIQGDGANEEKSRSFAEIWH